MTYDTDESTLHLTRLVHARRELVFAACTRPDLLAQWWGPTGFSAPSVEIDLRVGGKYRIVMQPPEGDAFRLSGEFREVVAPARIAYTFRWEPPDVDDVETLVELVFTDVGAQTEMRVTHGGFATAARRSFHETGWAETLDRLQELAPALVDPPPS